MIPWRLLSALFAAAFAGYVALSFTLFEMPQTQAAAEECGFLPGEFVSAGTLTYARNHAFAVSFLRKEEYFTAATVGLAVAFLGFALSAGRRGGAGASAGIAAGSGVLAVGALCISCLAPVLSAVGLGLAGTFLAGVPKALLFLNALLLTVWGVMFLSRRSSGASCALPARQRA
ncbi:hypothetical protein [Poseidonocella sp. HB161398]|uniref:hypothetical protein n=1 Tax=Poseidonocella sp. HB161398 TaxID=2320855 RepID=UPI001108A32B|nr:hypothetical protein [Poseidonocella sp. HB161398]